MLLTVLGLILMAISGYIYLLTGGNTDFTFAATVITFGAGISCIFAFLMGRMDYQFAYKKYVRYYDKFKSAFSQWEDENAHFIYLKRISNFEDPEFVTEYEATEKRLKSYRKKVLDYSNNVLDLTEHLLTSKYLSEKQRKDSFRGYNKAYDFIRLHGKVTA